MIKIKINTEKILEDLGIEISERNCIAYINRLVYYLNTHNKNYTKQQERNIIDLSGIIANIEIIESESEE